jgi:hypothetical protein
MINAIEKTRSEKSKYSNSNRCKNSIFACSLFSAISTKIQGVYIIRWDFDEVFEVFGRLGRQTWPAVLAGRLGRQTCPVDLAGRLGRHTWLAHLAGTLGRQTRSRLGRPTSVPTDLARRPNNTGPCGYRAGLNLEQDKLVSLDCDSLHYFKCSHVVWNSDI